MKKEDRTKFREAKRINPLRITGVIVAVLGALLIFLLSLKLIGLVVLIVGLVMTVLARRKIKTELKIRQ